MLSGLAGLIAPAATVEVAAAAPGTLEALGTGVTRVASKAQTAPSSISRWWDALTPAHKREYGIGLGAGAAGIAYLGYRHFHPATAPATSPATSVVSTGYPATAYYGTGTYGVTSYGVGTYHPTTAYVPQPVAGTPSTSTVTVGPPPPPVRILSQTLPPPTVGTLYSAQFVPQGGTAPYMWQGGVGAPGLSITSSGQLTGIPAAAGTFAGTVTVTDAAGLRATRNFTFAVRKAVSTTPAALPLTIPIQALPAAQVGSEFSHQWFPQGGTPPYQWSGSVSPGLELLPSGLETGMPTAPGSFPGNVSVTDSTGKRSTRTFTQTVRAAKAAAASTPAKTTTVPTKTSTPLPASSVVPASVLAAARTAAARQSAAAATAQVQATKAATQETQAANVAQAAAAKAQAERTAASQAAAERAAQAAANARVAALAQEQANYLAQAPIRASTPLPASVAAAARTAAARQSAGAVKASVTAAKKTPVYAAGGDSLVASGL